ncbi:hypothetical protein ACVBEJ_08640 [Porticoccus sp. GXU_MW_L64]
MQNLGQIWVQFNRFPERKMCRAIGKAPTTIEGYHPIHAIRTFPGPYERHLGHYYDFDLKPHENLSNRLNSGRSYGRELYGYGPRHTWVYKKCMGAPQQALVDNLIDVMRACDAGNFGIYVEKIGGGVAVEGDNGRNCRPLYDELIKVHLQGYKPSLLGSITGFFGGAQVGPMVKAFDRCESAGKEFSMEYGTETNKLTFSCGGE